MRPEFHFTAHQGWINDPHGITARDGGYDLFYQYVPSSTVWQPNCHWGHAAGPDLVSFTERGVAIAPGDGDDGIWTGSLVIDDGGEARVFYTSTAQPDVGVGRIRLATPDDDSWDRWSKGPFVAHAPETLDIVAYRDPFIRREPDGSWRMFVGAGLRDGTATALTYRSPDLGVWQYDGIALQRSTDERDPVWMGALWECPQFFEVDGRDVMVSSVWDDDVLHYAGYVIGTYADGRFQAETWGRLTFGSSYYAPSFFRDAAGRPCLTFWMRGISDVDAGWASAHSLPHLLRVDGDRLLAAPHDDLDSYRRDDLELGTAADARWLPRPGETLEIRSGDDLALELIAGRGEIVVRSATTEERVPWSEDPVRIVVDAQVVEVSSTAGIIGLAAAVTGPLRFSGSEVETVALSRS